MCLEKTVRENGGEKERELIFTLQTHLLISKLKSLLSTSSTVTSDMLALYTTPYSNSSVILILTLTLLLISVVILQLLVEGDTSEQ